MLILKYSYNLRIEGAEGTVYEGIILTGPQNVTTASGGTHLCDGTNDNANPNPAANGISGLVSAGGLCSFSIDGTFSSEGDDFFITRIGASDSTSYSDEYWGILNNFVFTLSGGCETEPAVGDELLWAFNAFNVDYFLDVEPRSVTLNAGASTNITISGYSGYGGAATPIAGAEFNGLESNADGQVVYVATTPGTYRLKATASDAIRSPAVIITVV